MFSKKRLILNISIIIVFISTIFSMSYGWIPIFGRTWLWIFLLLIIICVLNFSSYLKPILKYLYVYGIILLFNNLFGDKLFTIEYVLMEFGGYLCIFVSLNVIVNYLGFKSIRLMLLLFVITVIITFVSTYSFYILFPDMLRDIQHARQGGDSSLFVSASKYGVESYTFGHALPALIPVLIFVLKEKFGFLIKIIDLLIIGVLMGLVYMSTATTALLLGIFLILISFFWNHKSINTNIRNMIVIGCLFFSVIIFKDFFLLFLDYLKNNIEGIYQSKIEEFEILLKTGESGDQMNNRGNLYFQSIESFLGSPIWGIDNDKKIGGHAFFIDHLAMLGIIGILPLFSFYICFGKFVGKYLSKELKPYFYIGYSYFWMLGFLKSIYSFDYVVIVLFFMPLLCIYVNKIFIESKYKYG